MDFFKKDNKNIHIGQPEKYTKNVVPSETILQRKCLPLIYGKVIEKLQNIAKNKNSRTKIYSKFCVWHYGGDR